jgi:hypothetical protein
MLVLGPSSVMACIHWGKSCSLNNTDMKGPVGYNDA